MTEDCFMCDTALISQLGFALQSLFHKSLGSAKFPVIGPGYSLFPSGKIK